MCHPSETLHCILQSKPHKLITNLLLCRYHVRLDAARTRDTQLLFVTTGILLRTMTGDPLLAAYSHVIVDEVLSTGVSSRGFICAFTCALSLM